MKVFTPLSFKISGICTSEILDEGDDWFRLLYTCGLIISSRWFTLLGSRGNSKKSVILQHERHHTEKHENNGPYGIATWPSSCDWVCQPNVSLSRINKFYRKTPIERILSSLCPDYIIQERYKLFPITKTSWFCTCFILKTLPISIIGSFECEHIKKYKTQNFPMDLNKRVILWD
jgi:hypothetical protein